VDEPVIRTDGLTKKFMVEGEELFAVRDVSFEVGSQKLVCLTGPSGCGTSTTLKMLGGILDPSSGTINLNGTEYRHGIPRESLDQIGYVFQTPNLLDWRTVRENLQLPLQILGRSGDRWQNRIDDLLDMVGLSDFHNAYPHELSGGMKQRVGVIRALVHDPKIILMDNPFGALDAITRKLIHHEFLDLWKRTQKTIFMVTNHIDEALFLSSKVLIMSSAPGHVIHEVEIEVESRESHSAMKKGSNYRELHSRLKDLIGEQVEQERIQAPAN